MSEFNQIYLLGYSGHSYVAIDAALSSNLSIGGYFDLTKAKQDPYELAYCGYESEVDINNIVNQSPVFPAIGSNNIRKRLIEFILSNRLHQEILIHSSAIVSPKVSIGKSTLISPGAIINSFTNIGVGAIINTGAIVEHECNIGDFSHIAPGTVLAGGVTIGAETFIGANTTIKEGITIGDNVIIGAGSVVLKNITDNETWVGNPAKPMRQK